MVGAILTQNTNWKNVERALNNLKQAGALDPDSILATHHKTLASWLRPSGYFNVKSKRLRNLCRWLVKNGGVGELQRMRTPVLRNALLSVYGVGRETADDILLYAFDRPVFVIDAYTRRIFSRLGMIRGNEDYEVIRRLFESKIGAEPSDYKEYHALIVLHGKTVCRPAPYCEECCIRKLCAFRCTTS
jgi:endonuclease-3 related protein